MMILSHFFSSSKSLFSIGTSFLQYRPQLFIRTSDVTVSLTHPPGTEDADEKMVMPGDNVEMVGDLVHDVALEVGSRFTLREGGKTSEFSWSQFTFLKRRDSSCGRRSLTRLHCSLSSLSLFLFPNQSELVS